jgi:hypothetical protein
MSTSEKNSNDQKPVSREEGEKSIKYTRETTFNKQVDEMLKKLSQALN